ncbi:MAG: glutamate 5-kinase [Desulfovibrionaceae bacterium]|nr:glutamate 5-kinase [Desulfovibrionaceae bacterium]
MSAINQEENWKIERNQTLAYAKTIVFKVGSAVIANDCGLNLELMQHLASQMETVWQKLPSRRLILVTSAAVAAGKAILRQFKNDAISSGLSARQAVAAIGQAQLMQAWDKTFLPFNRPTAQVLLTREDLKARQHFLNIRNTLAELLEWQVLPIVNENDTVSVQELKFGDNDTLASLLVNLVDADLCVNLTSAKGLYAEDPAKNPKAPIVDHLSDVARIDLNQICGSKTNVGTGGMYSKLKAARRTAQIGVPTLILPGKEPDIIVKAFEPNSTLGTWICRQKDILPRRKYWLAYQSEPQGELFLDHGAVKALLEEGRSLLPQGIQKITGIFPKGALVKIWGDGEEIGVGLSNYSSADLSKILGLKRIEVAAFLGDAHYPSVIHRDNMVLHAVI